MATEKALYTTKTDFQTFGFEDVAVNPLIGHDTAFVEPNIKGSNFALKGTAAAQTDFGTAPRAQSMKTNGASTTTPVRALAWSGQSYANNGKIAVSIWVKPNANSLAKQWAIFATNRGNQSTAAENGFHLAINKDTASGIKCLHARVVVAGVAKWQAYTLQEDMVGQGTKLFQFDQDKWYHIYAMVDTTQTWKIQVFVDGVLVLRNSTNPALPATFTSAFTVGDMLTSAGALTTNGFLGEVAEPLYLVGDNVWTETQMNAYRNGVLNGAFLDVTTTTGSVQLPKDSAGRYVAGTHTWTSPVVDLTNPFDDYGAIRAVGQIPTGTIMNFYTRASDDGATFDSWVALGQDGHIYSNNKRYLQVKVEMSTTLSTATPLFEEIQVLDYAKARRVVLATQKLLAYRDLESGLFPLGEIRNTEPIIDEEINGQDIMTFTLPFNDKKRKELGDEPELVFSIGDRYYKLKQIKDKRDSDGKIESEFTCEANWIELNGYYVESIELVEVTPYTALATILSSIHYETGDPLCDWTIGRVDITKLRTIRKTETTNVLALIREVQSTWGGEIYFDTKNKTISLLERVGKDIGVRFYYEKNLQEVERTIDTYNLVTRIYPKGKGDLDISTVHPEGKTYIENLEWVEALGLRQKIYRLDWSDERYTIPQNLYDDGKATLDEMARPTIAYVIKIHDLSALSGHEHEAFELGDTITVVDKDLFGVELPNRVVRRKWNVKVPEDTEVELSIPQKTLADIQARAADDTMTTLTESDPLSTTDAQQMTVFNQLLNSRGDDGLESSWTVDSGVVDTDILLANAGFSGEWSFQLNPDYGKSIKMTQTVDGVSHRSSYTVSCAVAKEGEITRGGQDAFVGIKVLVYYKDDPTKPQEFLLKAPDITDAGTGGA